MAKTVKKKLPPALKADEFKPGKAGAKVATTKSSASPVSFGQRMAALRKKKGTTKSPSLPPPSMPPVGMPMDAQAMTGGQSDMAKPKLGSGGRFAALTAKIAAKGKVSNPAAVAAMIGRKKYGAKRMAAMAAAGKKRGKQ